MAGNIKGIIVEIGGDTSGLQKALSKVNSVTSSLSKELKGVNSLLKLDPKNTELLKQKQDILNNSIATTEDKLKQLKQIKDEADKKMAEGTKINEENYRTLQREIINTQNKLNILKTEASSWNAAGKKLEEYGQKLEDLGTKADKVANKMTAGLTIPIIAGYTAMTKSAIENETAVQQVERIYGDAAESIKEFAENKALDYNMSASEAYKYSQIYGNLIQTITDDQTENAEQTQKLLQASSVIASSTGRSMEDVMDRIRSGLLGNTEAIEDLGVNVNVALLQTTDAFKQIAGDKSWDKLTFQEQQQVRMLGILEQTSKKYGDEVQDNTASSIQKLTAKTKNLTNNLGKKLLPVANKLLDKANDLIDKFSDLSDEEQENIIKIGLMVAASGPLLKVASTAITVTGKVTKGIGNITQAIGVASGKMTSTETSVNNLAKVFKAMFSPTGLAVVGITTMVAIMIEEIERAESETRKSFCNMGNSASDFITGIDNATSYLDSFNSTLFASTEEQQELQDQMQEIQEGITKICKNASDERRDYTQEEITQLDEYFTKLRELKNREIEIQSQIAGAITQQAVTNAETFQGSLEEYKVQSQEWIKTAQEQSAKTIEIIEQGSIEEVALLNQKFGEEATMQNEAYATEYNNLMEQKQFKIDAANEEVAKVNKAYANGYTERLNTQSFISKKIKTDLSVTNLSIEDESQRHVDSLSYIQSEWHLNENERRKSIEQENNTHKDRLNKIWASMVKNMSDSEQEQLGIWLGLQAQSELYGNEIDEQTREIVDSIIDSYDSMPKKTKEAMKNAMQPMLEEMQKSEPTLYAKANNIADGILSRLKRSFDIHSPSRKTRKIFKQVMQGSELGLEDEKETLFRQVEQISSGLLDKFKNITLGEINMGNLKNSIIDSTKTIFTTPQIVFNVQELDEAKLQQCFNYVNRKFGSQY